MKDFGMWMFLSIVVILVYLSDGTLDGSKAVRVECIKAGGEMVGWFPGTKECKLPTRK